MYRTESEILRNILLGEAIFELLDESVNITNTLLVKKLQDFLALTSMACRKTAIHEAISQITLSDSEGINIASHFHNKQALH